MIRLAFDQDHTPADRKTALTEYEGKTVTVRTSDGEFTGELALKSGRLSVGGTRVALPSISELDVHTGGDWTTRKGHQSGTKLARIWVRCTDAQKRKIAAAATKSGQSISEWLLSTAERSLK
jgi:hypothetical protein